MCHRQWWIRLITRIMHQKTLSRQAGWIYFENDIAILLKYTTFLSRIFRYGGSDRFGDYKAYSTSSYMPSNVPISTHHSSSTFVPAKRSSNYATGKRCEWSWRNAGRASNFLDLTSDLAKIRSYSSSTYTPSSYRPISSRYEVSRLILLQELSKS